MNETWKKVPLLDYCTYYEVSNLGRVKRTVSNTCTKAGYILKGSTTETYNRVKLFYDGKMNRMCVHRLVAIAFIPNPENKPHINHIDGNKLNNHAENLDWCTQKENEYHAMVNGLKASGSRNGAAKLTESQVKEIRKLHVPFSKVYSSAALGRKYGVSAVMIGLIVNRHKWKHI